MTDGRTETDEGDPTEGGGEREARSGGQSRVGAIALAALVLVAIAAVVTVLVSALDPEVPEEGVTVEDVLARTDELAGERVTVAGEIASFIVPGQAFPLGEGLRETVLVVPARGARVPETSEDEVVQVTGTVESLDPGELANRTAVNLEGEVFDRFDDRPVILASAIDVIPTDRDPD